MIPRALLYSDVVSKDARLLWAVLDDLARDAMGAIAATADLAAVMECSGRQVRRLVVELVDTGWLVVRGREGGRHLGAIYQPCRRPRPVNETWTDVSTFPRLTLDGAGRGRRVMHSSLRAREEEKTGALFDVDGLRSSTAARRRTPWCGVCDRDDHRWIQNADGSVSRCSRCHPANTGPAPF